MKRVTRDHLIELSALVTSGYSSNEIAAKLNAKGLTTPNGCAWNLANVSYYRANYKLTNRKRFPAHAGNMRKTQSKTITPAPKKEREAKTVATGAVEKIRQILALNLSKQTTLAALSELV